MQTKLSSSQPHFMLKFTVLNLMPCHVPGKGDQIIWYRDLLLKAPSHLPLALGSVKCPPSQTMARLPKLRPTF